MSVALVALCLSWALPLAYGAYPGTNGDIAFSSTRNSNIAIYQVNPGDQNLGTSAGDGAATSQLTLGGGDVEPFYSRDGRTVYFSSDRDDNGDWVIYSVPQGTPESASAPATELSAVSGTEVHNDYSPSVAPDGETVVFNRDNTSIDTLWAPTGPSSVCTLDAPASGLAAAGTSDGSGSRTVFDPADPSKLVFVSANGHIHLLSGITFPGGTNPCNETGLTDTDLSAAAFPSTSQYATGADANPDWSPNGEQIIFNSTRGGGNTLFIIDLSSGTPTGDPLWPALAAPNQTISTEPVFSPDGTQVAFVNSRKGSSIYDEMLVQETNGQWQGNNAAVNLTAQMSGGVSFDSEPDWQPVPQTSPPPTTTTSPGQGQVPESPAVPLLPVAGVGITAGGFFMAYLVRRRKAAA